VIVPADLEEISSQELGRYIPQEHDFNPEESHLRWLEWTSNVPMTDDEHGHETEFRAVWGTVDEPYFLEGL